MSSTFSGMTDGWWLKSSKGQNREVQHQIRVWLHSKSCIVNKKRPILDLPAKGLDQVSSMFCAWQNDTQEHSMELNKDFGRTFCSPRVGYNVMPRQFNLLNLFFNVYNFAATGPTGLCLAEAFVAKNMDETYNETQKKESQCFEKSHIHCSKF